MWLILTNFYWSVTLGLLQRRCLAHLSGFRTACGPAGSRRPLQRERCIWKRAGRPGRWRTGREEERGSGSKPDIKKRVRPGTRENRVTMTHRFARFCPCNPSGRTTFQNKKKKAWRLRAEDARWKWGNSDVFFFYYYWGGGGCFFADVLIGHRDVHLNFVEFITQNREGGSRKARPH